MFLDQLSIAHYYLQSRLRTFPTRVALWHYQEKRIRHLLKHVYPLSKYTRQRFLGRQLSEWQDIAIMEKVHMMAHFDDLNTANISKEQALAVAERSERSRDFRPMLKGYTVGLSSGTSGNRGLFLVSRQERLRWAGAMLAKVLPSSLLAKQRIAFFLRANSNLYTTVSSRQFKFEFFDLQDALTRHIQRLNDLQPSLLIAPPSMLRMLVRAIQKTDLSIEPLKVISVAEVLDPLDEDVIQQALGQKVHQVYQATEGFLATTCTHGTLHLNEDLVHIEKEPLGAGKFIPIITDLYRTTQPIIRYRLADILSEQNEACPCGSVMTALSQIEGRCDDVFYLAAVAGGWKAIFPDYIRRCIIGADARLETYLVQQRSPELIEVFLAAHNVQINVKRALNDLFLVQGVHAPHIAFIKQQPRPEPTRKLRRVVRCFEPEDYGISPF